MCRAAGTIFSGTVVLIETPQAAREPSPATVAITFHVEHAIRGTMAGEQLTIFEWAGLWTGPPRYRVGERLLLFFYPPSRLGLTSPVAGTLGRFAIDRFDRIVLATEHRQVFHAEPILAGKSLVRFNDFARAVRRASGEE